MRWGKHLVAACILLETATVYAGSTKNRKYGQNCENDSDCMSQFCNDDSTCGCSVTDTTSCVRKNKPHCVKNPYNDLDHPQVLSQLCLRFINTNTGDKCFDPLECTSGFCSRVGKKKVCTDSAGGKNSACRANSHCLKGFECTTKDTGHLGKCVPAKCTAAGDCSSGSYCKNNRCVNTLSPGKSCTEDESCSSGTCQDLECTCSDDIACLGQFSCRDNLCRLPYNKPCQENDECLSGICNSGSKCGCHSTFDPCSGGKECRHVNNAKKQGYFCKPITDKADGESCEEGKECQGGNCVNNECHSADGSDGAACDDDDDCAGDTFCVNKECHSADGSDDAACDDDDDCAGDTFCVNEKCHVNDGSDGAACVNNYDCAGDTFCVNEQCHSADGSDDEVCEDHDDCAGDTFCVNEKCHVNDGSDGAACVNNYDCAGDTFCVNEQCHVNDGNLLQECTENDDCLKGHCVKGKCNSHSGDTNEECGEPTKQCNEKNKCQNFGFWKKCKLKSGQPCSNLSDCYKSICFKSKCRDPSWNN